MDPKPPPDPAVEPRRRGRPVGSRLMEPTGPVTVWLPASTHDRLIRLANREEQSISKTIRELLILTLRQPR